MRGYTSRQLTVHIDELRTIPGAIYYLGEFNIPADGSRKGVIVRMLDEHNTERYVALTWYSEGFEDAHYLDHDDILDGSNAFFACTTDIYSDKLTSYYSRRTCDFMKSYFEVPSFSQSDLIDCMHGEVLNLRTACYNPQDWQPLEKDHRTYCITCLLTETRNEQRLCEHCVFELEQSRAVYMLFAQWSCGTLVIDVINKIRYIFYDVPRHVVL